MSHTLREILVYAGTVAVAGASQDPSKPSGKIPYLLHHRGFRIIPVNPNAEVILGQPAYASLLDTKESVVRLCRGAGT